MSLTSINTKAKRIEQAPYNAIPGSRTIWWTRWTRETCLERGRRGVALEMKMDGVLQAEQGIHRLAKGPPLRTLSTPSRAPSRSESVILAFAASSHSFPASGDKTLAFQVMQHMIHRAQVPADGVLRLLADTADDLVSVRGSFSQRVQ